MNIIHVVSSGNYIPETGIHTYVTDLCNSLNNKGFKNIILVIKEKLDGAEIIDQPAVEQLFIHTSAYKKQLLDILEKHKPTYFHFHSMLPFELFNEVLTLLKSNQIKSILTIHNNSLLCYKGNMAFKNKVFCTRNNSNMRCLTCLTHQHKFTLPLFILNIANSVLPISKNYRINYLTLLNSFRTNVRKLLHNLDEVVILDLWVLDFLPKEIEALTSVTLIQQATKSNYFANKKPISKSKEVKLAYIGRTDRTKGLLTLIKALRNLENIKLDCFIEVTDQLYYEQGLKIVNENQLNVSFFAPIKHNKMNEVLLGYDILCLPSYSEMAPMLSLEALGFGIPIIASDHPSFVSQSKLNSGISLFKNGSVSSLNKVLRAWPEKEPSIVSNNCNYEELISKHTKLYNQFSNVE
jgi:glycosyltransferase involved in cell wall biosynthesis